MYYDVLIIHNAPSFNDVQLINVAALINDEQLAINDARLIMND